MNIKCKTFYVRTWEKHLFLDILHQHWYNCPIALPVLLNPQHESVLTVVSAASAPDRTSSATIERPSGDLSTQLWTAVRDISHRKQETFMSILCIESFCPLKTHNGTLLFGSRLKHGSHFDYWNQPLNLRMCVCYLDCHESGVRCCLMMHIETLLRPLQLFFLRLWIICRFSLIVGSIFLI
jgi:hypothetical protein